MSTEQISALTDRLDELRRQVIELAGDQKERAAFEARTEERHVRTAERLLALEKGQEGLRADVHGLSNRMAWIGGGIAVLVFVLEVWL